MKESRYVKLANTMFRVLKKARIPLFLHARSNHIFTIWQHIILLVLRQYERKSYRMFTDWLIEAYYLRNFLELDYIPHFTTLQKFAARIADTLLAKIISSFILLLNISRLFIGIDSTGFKMTNASEYYTYKAKLRKKYIKLSASADMLFQLIVVIKIRRAPTTKHDTKDFQPLIIKSSDILPISITVTDKGYDSEDNHVFVREYIHAFSIIPARFEYIPLWRTYGKYRKQMKMGYSKILYHQRNKNETIMSVIKRLFGEYLISKTIRTQNKELSFRCIAYNMHRLTNLVIIVMFST